MAKSIEKSVDRNGIPLSLTKRNARGTRDERTTRVSVREWYAKRITCNVSRCVSVLEERIVRVSRVAINARKKRINSAATFYFPLVSIPLRSRFRGTGRMLSNRRQQTKMLSNDIFDDSAFHIHFQERESDLWRNEKYTGC